MWKKVKVPLIILLFGLSVTVIVIYFFKNAENTFADEIITEASTTVETKLSGFLKDVSNSVNQINKTITSYDISNFQSNNLNQIFSDIIEKEKYTIGIALSNNNFNYIIYRDKSSWATTFDKTLSDSISNWQRLNNKLEVVSEWTDVYTVFPSSNNINEIKHKLKRSKYIWKVSNNGLSDHSDLLSLVFNTQNTNNDTITAVLIYSAVSLSRNFAEILKYDEPLVSILTSNNEVITPVITNDTSSINLYKELSKKIDILIGQHNKDTLSTPRSYSFEKDNQVYWTRVVNMPSKLGVQGFALTISASDLAFTEKKQELIYLYIGLIGIVITIILLLITRQKKKSNVSKNETNTDISTDEILNMIRKGETEFVEFKSSLRWDYREGKVNKVLETVILKSISAFANGKGGNLFIGVSDDMQIIGLQNDYNTFKKHDADYFELHLRKLIANQYGLAFSNEHLGIGFYRIDNKDICLIQITPSGSPVFLKTKSKQGTEIEKFYVRSGNASQEIASLSEINDYINARFGG